MPHTCQTCTRRKVKCDKVTPTCSACRKSRLDCVYQTPPAKPSKRKASSDIWEKLTRYERILRQHDLLDSEELPSPGHEISKEPVSLHWNEPETSRPGQLLSGGGRSKYVDSKMWRNFGDDEVQRMYEEDEQAHHESTIVETTDSVPDPLTTAMVGSGQNLLDYHPSHPQAMLLWKTHVENVEPVCRILHIPSTARMVEATSKQPARSSPANECLLFAIYHFAVFSMTEKECAEKLGQSHLVLMRRYHLATQQALANASFLKTTEMSVLQALVLFLISSRRVYDAHTYWILTGVAVRIAQRMGIHRDGEELGSSPYDVQMKRRLFYQLLPLDAVASQMSGTVTPIIPGSWDTKTPLNVDDSQIWPGMKDKPIEQKCATDMIFCLSRYCVGKSFLAAAKSSTGTGSWEFKDHRDAEKAIREAECEVEEKYIRYCDVVNPLHFLTVAMARSAITTMRLRLHLPKARNDTATDGERREMLQLAQKIMDSDSTVCGHEGAQRYRWLTRPFFLWGTWDSFIYVLNSLWKRSDLLSTTEIEAAWNRVEKIYRYHDELLVPSRTLHVAFGRLTLKAWDARPGAPNEPEPAFISKLRFGGPMKQPCDSAGRLEPNMISLLPDPEVMEPTPASTVNVEFDELRLDTADWLFWDELTRGY